MTRQVPVKQIELEEETDLFVAQNELNETQALAIYQDPHFEIEWPNPGNAFRYRLRSNGWVGHFQIGDTVMVVKPKVAIANIFGMLEVAYKLKSFKIVNGETAVQSLDEVYEHISSILAQRVNDRWRKGLYRSYISKSDDLEHVRGRIDIRGNMRNVLAASPRLHCNYEELTADVEENTILLWALYVASRSNLSRADVRRQVRQAFLNLAGDVSLEPKMAHDCVGRFYHRMNHDYKPMHGLSRFIIENTGPDIEIGGHKFLPFSINMPQLFEGFIAEYLAQKLPQNLMVDVQYHARLKANAELSFRIDLVVRDRTSGQALSVIDTKYKTDEQPLESDIQQIVAYAVELGVSRAYLVYPFALRQPVEAKVGSVQVSTLGVNLNGPFPEIWSLLAPATMPHKPKS